MNNPYFFSFFCDSDNVDWFSIMGAELTLSIQRRKTDVKNYISLSTLAVTKSPLVFLIQAGKQVPGEEKRSKSII
jgi:hypothetical protein